MDEAVVMRALTPWQAALNDAPSRRSPSATVAPRLLSFSTLAGSDVARTKALTGLPAALSSRQTSVPTIPVAPTTRFMDCSPFLMQINQAGISGPTRTGLPVREEVNTASI